MPRTPDTTGRPPPRWARAAAWACLLLPLPSVVWRLAMLAGVDLGFADAGQFVGHLGPTLYVLGLNLVELLAGLACLGLVQSWGERVPGWVPRIGGRTIPALLPVGLATVGNLTMYAIWAALLSSFVPAWTGRTDAWTPDRGMDAGERALLLSCYLPFGLWPVAVTVATLGYWLRRR